jgi:hypothetical protein
MTKPICNCCENYKREATKPSWNADFLDEVRTAAGSQFIRGPHVPGRLAKTANNFATVRLKVEEE